jgi:toxin ParE1/3/4
MPRYRITPKAEDDLRNISRYTQQQKGGVQRNDYFRKLEKRFPWLAQQPQFGKHRPEVGDNYYSFPEGQHVMFYLVNPDCIDIIGIPHKHTDIIHYFDSPERR